MTIRRFIITALLLGVIGSMTAAAIYLYNFDLNSFRAEIETLASEKLARPLTLGRAHLSFRHGPAFAFDSVKVGSTDDDLSLTVERVYFRLQTLPLLTGEILFSEILLEKPDLRAKITHKDPNSASLRLDTSNNLLSGELIQSLRVLDGRVEIEASSGSADPAPLIFEGIRFSIDDFSFLRAGNIAAEATVLHRGVRSPLTLHGEYRPLENTTSWDGAYYRLDFSLQNFSANSLRGWLDQTDSDLDLRGHADLELQMEGTPQTGLTLSTRLTGKKLELQQAAATAPPMQFLQGMLSASIVYAQHSVDIETTELLLDTSHGQIEIKNRSRLDLSDGRATGFTGKGSFTARLAKESDLPIHPFFSRHLAASYLFELKRNASGWALAKGRCTLPGIEIDLRGQLSDSKDVASTLTVDLADTSLTSLVALMPGLSRLELSGQLAARLNLSRGADASMQVDGRLNLADIHLAIPGKLADLNGLSGVIDITNSAISADNLQAQLGRSPISIDLDIPDLARPEVTLHVLGESIRADELIFHSDSRYLTQVDGIVRLADNTVFLGPIHVKMDGGTDATVNGTVRNFAAADVDLQIEGRHGNIDEIIALWEHHQSDQPAPPPAPHGSLTIDINTASGQISGMQFDQASAQIVRRNDTLVIGPIHFHAGAGEGLGQVLIVHQDSGASFLKISGNLKNFDAQTVYQQILKRKGLVSGRLNGDFYLEGTAGAQFLPTSFGAFAVQIEDGRLNKLTGLAKLLHILNLYPILTENVQGKGLPYDKISFNAMLDKGRLSTEDYLMQGSIMNMSLTGAYDLIGNTVDFELGAMPLRSVDSILSRIPIAGWILTGSQKSLLVAHFEMTGNADDPSVKSVPVESLTAPVIGIFKRVFTLPVEMLTDPEKVIINQ